MPGHSTAFKNEVLDGKFGSTRGSGTADSYFVELWHDRPDSVGATEADFGGYAAVELDSDDWDAAAFGQKSTTALVDFGTPSTADSAGIRYWALRDVVSGDLAYSAPLAEPLVVSAGGNPVLIRPTVTYP